MINAKISQVEFSMSKRRMHALRVSPWLISKGEIIKRTGLRIVGATPTGDAPTTSEWSTVLLITKVRLILETWWLLKLDIWSCPSALPNAKWQTGYAFICFLIGPFILHTLTKITISKKHFIKYIMHISIPTCWNTLYHQALYTYDAQVQWTDWRKIYTVLVKVHSDGNIYTYLQKRTVGTYKPNKHTKKDIPLDILHRLPEQMARKSSGRLAMQRMTWLGIRRR